MTFQTDAPVEEIQTNESARSWGGLIFHLQKGDISYDLPYQRGNVWTYEQRITLIYSILAGPLGSSIILNDRPADMWFEADGSRRPIYAVVDGKQRLTAVRMFMENDLLVPASWFRAEYVEATEDTSDGLYARYAGLSRVQQRFFENKPVGVSEARLKTVAAEAAWYLRVNGSGTPQTTEDMSRAAGVANERGN